MDGFFSSHLFFGANRKERKKPVVDKSRLEKIGAAAPLLVGGGRGVMVREGRRSLFSLSSTDLGLC